MYRKAYVEVNLNHIEENVKAIVNKYNGYQYYIGMIKSNAYGHGYGIVKTLIASGINYIAVSSLDEALEVRKQDSEIPILCTEIIDEDLIEMALDANITLTVDDIDYLKKIGNRKCKVHIKLNTGMNRLGVSTKEELMEIYCACQERDNIYLEGIYTHFGTPGIKDKEYDHQLKKFKELTSDIDLSTIPMIHLSSSFALLAHPKIPFENAVRIGTILYGYDISLKGYGTSLKEKLRKMRDDYYIKKYRISPVIRNVDIKLKPAMKLKTNVMEIRSVKKGDIIGYGTERIEKDTKIAVLPIGYDDGIGSSSKNRYALIHGKEYPFVGHMCMCMSFVEIDDSVQALDEVTLMGDSLTLGYMSRLKNTSIQETLVTLGKGLDRVYIKEEK